MSFPIPNVDPKPQVEPPEWYDLENEDYLD